MRASKASGPLGESEEAGHPAIWMESGWSPTSGWSAVHLGKLAGVPQHSNWNPGLDANQIQAVGSRIQPGTYQIVAGPPGVARSDQELLGAGGKHQQLPGSTRSYQVDL